MKKLTSCLNAVALMATCGVVIVGCVDDSYDLSDIDTTTEFKVKDLTIPVNIDEIKLSNIFDLGDDSSIKKTADGYAMIESGTFSSSPIDIPQIHIGAPTFEPSVSTLYPESIIPASARLTAKDSGTDIYFPIKDGHDSSFSYDTDVVSEYIVSMKEIGTRWDYKVTLTVTNVADKLRKFEFRNLKLELPAGLDCQVSHGSYDIETGVIDIPSIVVEKGYAEFSVSVSRVDVAKSGITYDYAAHSVKFDGHVGVVSGFIVANTADFIGITNLDALEFRTHNVLSDLVIDTFSGDVKYEISGFSIPSIHLDDLPDVLAQDETNIVLSNPQIYLRLNDPVGEYNVYAETGLTLSAERENEATKSYSLDKGKLRIGASAGVGPYTYCLALPGKPASYYEGYEDAEHVDFSGLADVLSGKGIPHSIGVSLDNPGIPVQTVNGFRLGKLDAVEGNYLFYVPFELGNGTTVVYSDRIDGWSSDDLNDLTISALSVSADITNDLPFDVELSGYPIDANGKIINNVTIEGAVIKGNKADVPLNIRITGEVKHLDGIYFEAVAHSVDTGKALSPDMTLHLKNIKVTVSGSYVKEL